MNIKQLSRKIKQSHRKTKSWNKTGKYFGITGGLAYRIAIHLYEPSSKETREKLFLNARPCPMCGHKIIKRKPAIKKDQPEYIKKWKHLPTQERNKAIEEYIKWKQSKSQ